MFNSSIASTIDFYEMFFLGSVRKAYVGAYGGERVNVTGFSYSLNLLAFNFSYTL